MPKTLVTRVDRSSTKTTHGVANTDQRSRPGRILLSGEALSGPGTRRPATAETLFAIAETVSARLSLADVLRQTTRDLARALGADVGSVWRLDAEDLRLLPVANHAIPKHLDASLVYPQIVFTHALAATVRDSGGPVYSGDSAHDARFKALADRIPHRSVLVQPLRVRGTIVGVFVFIWTRARHRFTRVQLRLVEAVTQHAGMAIDHAGLLGEVQQFREQLERRVRDRTSRLRGAYDELRKSREALRAWSTHAEHVRERERTRIAREIHDELGQALTALKLDLCGLAQRRDEVSGTRDMVRVSGSIDAMIDSVRRIASELRPQVLDDLGLMAALEWQVREFQQRTGVQCRLRCIGPIADVDVDRSTALFRAFQEILTNIARHAHASRAQITLTVTRSSASLQVRDNGRGMTTRQLPGPRDLGLLGIEERAAEFGGKLHVASAIGKGTTVRVRLPLSRARQREHAS